MSELIPVYGIDGLMANIEQDLEDIKRRTLLMTQQLVRGELQVPGIKVSIIIFSTGQSTLMIDDRISTPSAEEMAETEACWRAGDK